MSDSSLTDKSFHAGWVEQRETKPDLVFRWVIPSGNAANCTCDLPNRQVFGVSRVVSVKQEQYKVLRRGGKLLASRSRV